MNFRYDIPSNSIDNLKDHFVLMFDLISMQVGTVNSHYPQTVREPLRLKLNFSFPVKHVTNFLVLGERKSSVVVDKFDVVGKKL